MKRGRREREAYGPFRRKVLWRGLLTDVGNGEIEGSAGGKKGPRGKRRPQEKRN